jgi:acetolactate synthase-1/2/3 large subunit
VTYPDATPTVANGAALDRAADLLVDAERPVVYVGGGARRTPNREAVRDLVADLNLPVIASYKGKGVVPDDDPRMLGVTGSHTPASALRVLDDADLVVALGTDFDGVSTAHWEIPMGDRLVHVNLDPSDLTHPYDVDVGVVGDAGAAAGALRDAAVESDGWDGRAVGSAVREEYEAHLQARDLFADRVPMSTAGALRTIREAVPREAAVTTDVGGFRLWAKQLFDAYGPERYITAGSWAGMGVGLPAAIGAAVADPSRSVACLTGDGSLLMCLQELHTAADYGLDLAVFVFDNADYGIISKSGKIPEGGPQFAWESPDFAAIAEGFGVEGIRATTLDELRDAAATAVDADGPALVDVVVDANEPTAKDVADYESELAW